MARNRNPNSRMIMLIMFAVYCGVFSILVTFSSVIVNFAFAATYKWVDSDGVTHYTQKPPPAGVDAAVIKSPPKVDTDSSIKALEERQQLVDELREQRQKSDEEKRIAKEENARKIKNCELSKARLASYTKPRVKFLQEDGSRVRATEEERQKQIAKSKEMIKEFCN